MMETTAAPASRWIDRSLLPAIGLLVLVMAFFELTHTDLRLQDHFFDFGTGRWLVDQHALLPRTICYTGAKALIIAFGLGAFVCVLGPERWRARLGVPADGRRDLLIVVLTLALAPSLIAVSKAYTNVYCPYEIRRYGGDVPYVRVLEHHPDNDRPAREGHGYPAGHASGGFALLSLAGLGRTRRGRWTGLAVGMTYGWIMGLYQMFKGAHYLSHTIVAMIVVWIVFLLLRRLLPRRLPGWHRSSRTVLQAGDGAG